MPTAFLPKFQSCQGESRSFACGSTPLGVDTSGNSYLGGQSTERCENSIPQQIPVRKNQVESIGNSLETAFVLESPRGLLDSWSRRRRGRSRGGGRGGSSSGRC